MKIILLILLFINLLFANQEPLKIAINKDMIPYSYIDVTKKPNGLFIEYWQLWAEKSNQKIEFIPFSRRDSMSALKEGKVDIHVGMFKQNHTFESINYVKPTFHSKSYIYINTENKNKIKKIKDLNNKTIGLISHSFFDFYIQKNFPKIKIKRYKFPKEMIQAINKKEIDSFIDDSLLIWIETIRHSNFITTIKLPNFTLDNWFYAATTKDNKNLNKIVLEGMNKITKKELIALEEKWIVDEDLRFYAKEDRSYIFTTEEKKWLEKNKIITLAVVKDWERFSSLDKEGKIKGFHLDLIKQINKNLNTNITYKVFENWTKAYTSAKEGKIDGILGLSWSKQREKFFNYSPSYHYSPYFIVTRQDDTIKTLNDFKTRTAVTLENSITNKIIKDKEPSTNILYVQSIKEILIALRDKKADVALLENAKELNLKEYNLKIVTSIFTKEGELSIGISKNKKIVTNILRKAINSVSEEQMITLKKLWFNKKSIFTYAELNYIKNSPALTIGVDAWAPFYFLGKNNKLDGMSADFFRQISKISGLKFKEVKSTWDDNLNNFKDEKIDILPAVFHSKHREKYGLFSDSYFDVRTSLFVKNNNTNIKSFKDLIDRKLAMVKSDGRIQDIKNLYKNIEIVETTNLKESFFKLLNNEVDAIAELDTEVQYLLEKEFISGIKRVFQNEIKEKSIHIFSKKDDFILQSILQKSLHSIPNKKREEIIKKWLKHNIKENVNIAFGIGREPYTLNKTYLKGIEYDLIQKILNQSNITIKNTKNLPQNDLEYLLKYDNEFDMVVSIKERKDGFYYSNNFINSQNVAISRIEDNIHIDNVKDLENKEIMAFNRAYKYLGKEYNKLFNPEDSPSSYMEVGLQEYQVRDFLEKKVPVIVIDINIFKWYLKKIGSDLINKYKIHSIFPFKDSYQVAFRDKNMRDIFNKNLKKIKDSGEYEEVFNNYIQYDIESKVRINSLIASIISKYIFSNDIIELDNIIESFTTLEYINKIEIFDNENNLLSTNTNEKFKQYITQNSFYSIDNSPRKVGYIKVYFDEDKLTQYAYNSQIIPNLETFQKLKSYSFIKNTYMRFGYFPKKMFFTKKEKDFIRNNPIVTFSQINWQPLSIVSNNEFSGVFADYKKIIEKKSGIEFKYIESNSWEDVVDKFMKKETDLIIGVRNVARSLNIGLVSNEFANFNYAIVSNKDASFINGLKDLEKRTIAMPRGYSSYNLIKTKYPNIKIIETKSINEALTLVSQGKAYAFIGHIAVSVFNIKNNFPELKIAGITEEKFEHHFLVQKSQPEFLSIINKIISSISQKEKQNIKDKWIKTKISTAVDYSIIYKIIAIFTIIILIILIFTKKLSKAKKQIEVTNKKLNESMNTLIKTQAQLVESKKMASLGGLVAGVAHEMNTPIGIGLTGITYFLEITEKIKKDYKTESMSQEEFEEYLETSEKLANSIHSNLDKTANLVRSFKQVAVNQTSEDKKEFNFKKYINEVLFSIDEIIKKTNLTVTITCDENLILKSYPGAFSQIITNLVINSIRHAFNDNEKGNILIEVSKEDDSINFIYKDDGKGIEEENMSKIFEPFFTTNREKGGTGLGLNVIYNIVTNNLKGTIVCNSKLGKGVEFIIKFRI